MDSEELLQTDILWHKNKETNEMKTISCKPKI